MVMTGPRKPPDREVSGREALGSVPDFVVAGSMKALLLAVFAFFIQASLSSLSASFLTFRISANCGLK
jgi:hypothetical protein